MAESNQGRLSRLFNRLRGKRDKKAEQEEIKEEVQETQFNIEEISDVLIGVTDASDDLYESDETDELDLEEVPIDRMAESNEGRVSKQFNIPRGKKDEEEQAELTEEEIRKVPIDLTQKKRPDSTKQIHGCDICMAESVFTLSIYLCYVCGVYMCEKCSKTHEKSHDLIKRKHRESKRKGKASNFVFGMRGESKVERGEDLYGECDEVIGHVDVKHESDKCGCYITGLSGLENKRWVAVDRFNDCIKIFCSVSNTLLRYIKFGSISKPWDVTEIKVVQKSTDPDSASGSKTDISGAARDEPDKHCLLAVTFLYIKQIWFIDVNKTPAVKTKTIKMDNYCSSIDFSEDNIFTLCEQNVESGSRYSIYILSIEGDQLKVVQIPGLSTRYIDDLAVYKGRVYLSDRDNDKVLYINVEDGKTISELTLERGSWPAGISVDPNNGVVYVCGIVNYKVYKLSPDLREYEPLSLDTHYTRRPYRLCFINNKLYFSHVGSPPLDNVVTVVHVLT